MTVRVYTPAIAAVAVAETVGLWAVDVNPLGPVQEYVVIAAGPPVRVRGVPVQTGLLEEAVASGAVLTTTVVVAGAVHNRLHQ